MDLQSQFENIFSNLSYGDEKNIMEANIVYECEVDEDFAKVVIILAEDSPLRETLPKQIEEKVKELPQINRVTVEVVAEPPPAEGHPEAKEPPKPPSRPAQQPRSVAYLKNYDNVIVVASGKGGVGKSTVSVNLSLALAQKGYQVSLFDADIYGPSLPIMMGLRGKEPPMEGKRMIPLYQYGIDALSIGNLVDEASALVWRGPMVQQALDQMLTEVRWPGGDFMIMDYPPGTGDIQLTLAQQIEIAGAIVVSTPQDVALLDAIKAVDMFTKVDIDIIGMVENMSSFICPTCQTETPIFGAHGAEKESEKLEIPFLGAIPIELDVRLGGDTGKPLMSQNIDSPASQAFMSIADNMIKSLEEF